MMQYIQDCFCWIFLWNPRNVVIISQDAAFWRSMMAYNRVVGNQKRIPLHPRPLWALMNRPIFPRDENSMDISLSVACEEKTVPFFFMFYFLGKHTVELNFRFNLSLWEQTKKKKKATKAQILTLKPALFLFPVLVEEEGIEKWIETKILEHLE